MDTWATRLGGLLLLLLAAWALSTLPHRRELKRLNQRESIGDEEVYRRYYADSGLSKVSVREVWMEIATTLRAPPDKLRPTDLARMLGLISSLVKNWTTSLSWRSAAQSGGRSISLLSGS